jgi:hypothetical protein
MIASLKIFNVHEFLSPSGAGKGSATAEAALAAFVRPCAALAEENEISPNDHLARRR